MVAAVLPLSARCEDEPPACAASNIAFTLPAPGDVIEAVVFVCGDTDEHLEVRIGVEMATDSQTRQVMLTVAGGKDLSQSGDTLWATVTATPALCDTGLTLTLAHLARRGELTGALCIQAVSDSGACELRVEGP